MLVTEFRGHLSYFGWNSFARERFKVCIVDGKNTEHYFTHFKWTIRTATQVKRVENQGNVCPIYNVNISFATWVLRLAVYNFLWELILTRVHLLFQESCDLFSTLYKSWCHNAVATFSLCLLTQTYQHGCDLLMMLYPLYFCTQTSVSFRCAIFLIDNTCCSI